MAALAIAFEDRPVQRQLLLEHPDVYERARLAFALLERRAERGSVPPP